MIDEFAFNLPTRIRFGRGARHALGAVARGHGRRVALIVDSGIAETERIRELEAAMGTSVEIVFRHLVAGEPKREAVLSLSTELRDARIECIVAVGGGSAIDLAKAAGILPTADGIDAQFGGQRVEHPVVPVIAVPTTAGTGAEVSHGAIVTDVEGRRKRALRGPGVAARDAVVDPELVVGAPRSVVAASGFDALAHAVETAVSRASNPLTFQLAAAALPRLLHAVLRLSDDPSDVDAASEAAFGALLMGINLANGSTCLPHRLQYPVGGLTGTGHAAGVAALFPAWLTRVETHAPDVLARLAMATGIAPSDADAGAAARALTTRILDHLDRTGMRTTLGALGLGRDDVPELLARVEGSVANDPGPVTPDDLRDLYLESL